MCWWIWGYAAVSVGLFLRPTAWYWSVASCDFACWTKFAWFACLIFTTRVTGDHFVVEVRTSVKRGMTEVWFGDFVLGRDRRMLFRHEFLIQNYSGGTATIFVGIYGVTPIQRPPSASPSFADHERMWTEIPRYIFQSRSSAKRPYRLWGPPYSQFCV
jgi:hypothetical protein